MRLWLAKVAALGIKLARHLQAKVKIKVDLRHIASGLLIYLVAYEKIACLLAAFLQFLDKFLN